MQLEGKNTQVSARISLSRKSHILQPWWSHGTWYCYIFRWKESEDFPARFTRTLKQTLSDGCTSSSFLFHLYSSHPLWKLDGGCFPFWSVAKCIFQVFYLVRSRTLGRLTPLVLITVQPPWQLLCVRTSHWPLTPRYPKFILLEHHNEGFTGPIAGFI